jgi:hypothetical protein
MSNYCLAGKGTNCRTVLYDGKIYEDLSEAIRTPAIKKKHRISIKVPNWKQFSG